VYLSHWFIREDRAKAGSNFMAAIPLSFILGSPLAGWILGHSWLGVDGWRWLFLLEGMPAVLLGTVAFFILTDWPRDAVWLTGEQRQWIEKLKKKVAPTENDGVAGGAIRPSPLLSAVAF
jgi:ACS family tartrate transporter-like MFS transporter